MIAAMNGLRIVGDGTGIGTHVYCRDENGVEVEVGSITRIEFLPLDAGGILNVRLTFIAPAIDVIAEQV